MTRTRERPKASPPESRRCADSAQHRVDEAITLRQLRRLHRRFTHGKTAGVDSERLSPKHLHGFGVAARQGVLHAK
eukprot:7584291-Pyramimonas_sp.AAC.1